MRILLVAPASGRWRRVGRRHLFNGRSFRFSLLSLLTVAAQTPPGHDLRLVDEQIDDVPWDEPFDLVGITCMTALAPRAYELARRFRARGVPVVLGGMHPTFRPDEALRHADAVCVGEAEEVWARIVEDTARGRLGGAYRAGGPCSLVGLPVPPRRLLDPRRYGTVQAVQATRGCPNRCSFCAVSAFHAGRFRKRPVEDVAAEVAALPCRFVLFVDDSLTADPDYARDLFDALEPLGRRWISQSTLAIADDLDLLRRAARSGCLGLFVGLETFSESNLHGAGKGFHRAHEYRERVRVLHDHGIGVEAGVVFGFDGDGPDVFRATLQRLDDIEVDLIQVSILTPLPGTPWFDTLEPRIHVWDWSKYDYHHAVFRPARMTPGELQAGHDWVTREFYAPWRIARRLARMAVRPGGMAALPYAAALNAAYYGRVRRWGIRGQDPSAVKPASRRILGARAIEGMRAGGGPPSSTDLAVSPRFSPRGGIGTGLDPYRTEMAKGGWS